MVWKNSGSGGSSSSPELMYGSKSVLKDLRARCWIAVLGFLGRKTASNTFDSYVFVAPFTTLKKLRVFGTLVSLGAGGLILPFRAAGADFSCGAGLPGTLSGSRSWVASGCWVRARQPRRPPRPEPRGRPLPLFYGWVQATFPIPLDKFSYFVFG